MAISKPDTSDFDCPECEQLRAEIEADKVLLRAAHKDCEQLRAELAEEQDAGKEIRASLSRTIERLEIANDEWKAEHERACKAANEAEAKLERVHSLLSRIHHDSRTDYVKSLANEVDAYFESIAGEGDNE